MRNRETQSVQQSNLHKLLLVCKEPLAPIELFKSKPIPFNIYCECTEIM